MATSTAKTGTTAPESTPAKRSLWLRMLVRLVLLLLVVAIGGAGYLYYRSNRLIQSEPYQQALRFVRESELVKKKIGGPLTEASFMEQLRNGSSVTDEGERGEASIQFPLTSPRGPIDVQASARKHDNEWSIQSLQVTLQDEKEPLILTSEVLLKTASETPKFDATKPVEKVETKIDLPSPDSDIKIEIPDIPPALPEQ